MGCEGRARGGPAPREQLRGPRLPREAGVWVRALTRPVASRRAGLRTDGDGARRGVPWQGIPPQGSQQSPLLIQPGQLWGCPTPIPAVPPCPEQPVSGPGHCLSPHLRSDTARAGNLCQMLCLSCRLCRQGARVPPACARVPPGTHMLDGSLGFPVSTSGLKATEPLREGPAACLDAETGDCGVDAPATERLG